MEMKIETCFDGETGTYTLLINGEVLMECCGWEDILSLSIKEIVHLKEENGIKE